MLQSLSQVSSRIGTSTGTSPDTPPLHPFRNCSCRHGNPETLRITSYPGQDVVLWWLPPPVLADLLLFCPVRGRVLRYLPSQGLPQQLPACTLANFTSIKKDHVKRAMPEPLPAPDDPPDIPRLHDDHMD
ncbi:hypothetical protein O3P69_002763 [Scylla paramamosain]|uniref:Uncharacterized protein n=1 Tax=Scylla paramamosain TaxID=85552 RepID=A0AAW0UR14_SCYPA